MHVEREINSSQTFTGLLTCTRPESTRHGQWNISGANTIIFDNIRDTDNMFKGSKGVKHYTNQ